MAPLPSRRTTGPETGESSSRYKGYKGHSRLAGGQPAGARGVGNIVSRELTSQRSGEPMDPTCALTPPWACDVGG